MRGEVLRMYYIIAIVVALVLLTYFDFKKAQRRRVSKRRMFMRVLTISHMLLTATLGYQWFTDLPVVKQHAVKTYGYGAYYRIVSAIK